MADLAGGLVTITTATELPDSRWDATAPLGGFQETQELADSRWASSEALGGFQETQELADSRWTANVDSPAGSVSTYLMRAIATSGGGTVFWQSQGSPDYAGTSAPVSVQSSTVVLVRQLA